MVFQVGDLGTKGYVILAGSCAVLCPKRASAELYQTAVLRAGDCFGELALRNSKPRTFSVLAREDTHVLSLERQDYHQAFGLSQENSLEEKIAFLMKNPIFALWTQSAVRRLSYFFREKQYLRKQVVFKAGSEVTEVLLVKSGEVKLSQAVSLPRKQERFPPDDQVHCEVELMLEREGELLGAYEVLMRSKHRYSCHCNSTQAGLLAISREDFEDLLADDRFATAFRALAKVKESYRSRRLRLASELARKERQSPDSHFKSLHEVGAKDSNALKARLIQHSVNLVKPRIAFSHMPEMSLHRQTVSLDFSPTLTASPLARQTQKTWSDIMVAKWQPEKTLEGRRRHTKTVVNFHTQRQKDLWRQVNSRLSSPPMCGCRLQSRLNDL